jgi:hypothetical protein
VLQINAQIKFSFLPGSPAARLRRAALRRRAVEPPPGHSEKFFRAGIDDGPEFGAVLYRLHAGGEPAVAVDPFLHCLGVIGQHIGCGPIVRHLHTERIGRVEMSRVKAEARARGGAYPIEGDDAKHQRAGGVADAIDDDPLSVVSDSAVFELVLIDEAAVVIADAIICEGSPSRSGDYASRAQDGQEEIGRLQARPQRTIPSAIMPLSSGRNLARPLASSPIGFPMGIQH